MRVTIKIQGAQGAGKSQLAAKLNKFLLAQGVKKIVITTKQTKSKPKVVKPPVIDSVMQNVLERIIKITADILAVAPEKITARTNFVDDCNADSLDEVELVMAFEEEFGLEIPDPEAEKIKTVGQAAEYIRKQLTKR